MDYKKHHDLLIAKRGLSSKPDNDDFYEHHHIIPRGLEGSDESSNKVFLTGREHFVIHWLLFKIHGCKTTKTAFQRMGGSFKKPNHNLSKAFESDRRNKADNHSEKYINGDIDTSRTGNPNSLRAAHKGLGTLLSESFKGLKGPMAKFIWDFYDEDGGLCHTGTYATFAKELGTSYSRVYSSFKNKGVYCGYTMGNERDNPYRVKAPLVVMVNAKTGETVKEGFKICEERAFLKSLGIFPAKANACLRGERRQTKGYSFHYYKE